MKTTVRQLLNHGLVGPRFKRTTRRDSNFAKGRLWICGQTLACPGQALRPCPSRQTLPTYPQPNTILQKLKTGYSKPKIQGLNDLIVNTHVNNQPFATPWPVQRHGQRRQVLHRGIAPLTGLGRGFQVACVFEPVRQCYRAISMSSISFLSKSLISAEKSTPLALASAASVACTF